MANEYQQILASPGGPVAGPTPPPSGAGVAAALSGLSGLLDTFSSSLDESARKKRQAAADARQARIDADKQLDKDAEAWAVRASVFFNQGIDPFAQAQAATPDTAVAQGATVPKVFQEGGNTPQGVPGENADIEKMAAKSAGQVAKIDAAVNQGTMPSISKAAAVDRILQEAVSRYPGREHIVLKALKDAGLEHAILDETTEEIDTNQTDRKTKNEVRANAYQKGVTLLGPGASVMTDDEIRTVGLEAMRRDAELEAQKTLLGIQGTIQDQTIKSTDFNTKQAGEALRQTAIQAGVAALAGPIQAFNKLQIMAGEPGANPDIERQLGELRTFITQQQGVIVGNLVAQLAVGASPEETSNLRSQLNNYIQDTFITPLEVRGKVNADAAKIIEDRLGLGITQSMPLIAGMQAAGIRLEALPTLVESVTSSIPGFKDRLTREVTGLANLDFNTDSAKLQLAEVVSLLSGNTTLKNYTPESAKNYLQTLWRFSLKEGARVAAGNMENADNYLNSYANIINATREINQNSGEQANLNATVGVTANGQARAALERLIANPNTKAEALAMAQGSRAAAAKVLSNFDRSNRPEGFWSVKYENGRYVPVLDRKAWDKASMTVGINPRRMVDSSGRPVQPPAPPQTIQSRVGAMNSLVDHLAYTVSWDEDAPKGTVREIKDYYATGKATPAMQKQKGKQKVNPEIEFQRSAQELREQLLRATPTLVVPSGGSSRGERNNNPGNLEDGEFAQSQPGYIGSDGRFAQFATPEQGAQAQEKLLSRNYISKGFNTVTKVIERYAPRGDNSSESVDNYIAYVASKLGIDPNAPISPAKVAQLAQAMREFETGQTDG